MAVFEFLFLDLNDSYLVNCQGLQKFRVIASVKSFIF